MNKYSDRPTLENLKAQVPEPPKQCNKRDCENDTTIQFVRVSINGRTEASVFTDVGYKKAGGLYLRGDYTFVDWVTRCGECYSRDLYRAGRGALQSLVENADENKKETIQKFIELMKQ